LPRYNSFIRTFNDLNKDSAQAGLHLPLVAALSKNKTCANSIQLCGADADNYLLNNLWVSLQSRRFNRVMRMSPHDDGSAGMLLMGLQTAAGDRELHVELKNGEIIVIPCEPGHLYVSNIAAAKHQVVHPARVPGVEVEGLGQVEIAIVVRSTWFGKHKARGCQGLEGRPFFHPCMAVLNNFLTTYELKIPTLSQVLAEHERFAAPAPEAKRRRHTKPADDAAARADI
jgi:hypothetical protein